jgi:hypothetical protein
MTLAMIWQMFLMVVKNWFKQKVAKPGADDHSRN